MKYVIKRGLSKQASGLTELSATQVDGAKSAVLLGSSPLLSVLTGSSPNIASHMEKNASVATEPARGFFTIMVGRNGSKK